ncbi:hypothetical protein Lcho_2190 [Leptothrix cholodnii SP-6]|uniref:Uncharacterized protein n=1 Tax=Leptothrix cholodnii (strain ATCC 51168 / LMG 8142 / SP-6) TaxID=395495 RepID=B1Y3C8_LEPCP|nr:hypothetical protein [Leptothrix cholodnii]ACB34456.1 hypothetical protein Lcho_2190 [Leptothrix cholodnii SP-6]
MRKPTTVMKTARQWLDLTAQLSALCAPDRTDLATLTPFEVEGLRVHAQGLAAVIGAWQLQHPTTEQGA